jgi:hypothetical protein
MLVADVENPTSWRFRAMVVEPIEQLKQKYTDKYVVVDAQRPELARFRDVVGQVKTVNMSGRALVEFGDYHVNIGWYDIDPSFLKVVDKPAPKPKEPAAKKPAAPAAKPAAAAAPSKPAAGKASVADVLTAARAGKAAAGGTAPAPAAAAKPAPAASGATPPKVDRSKMSVADMIAAAKAGGAPGTAPAASAAAKPKPAEPAKVEATEPAAAAAPPATKAPSGETVDRSKMTVDQMVAWCRAHDTK